MQNIKHLHIISFNIPYPANYGGVIDVFYKIKYLAEAGVKVHLHCYEYGRAHSPVLEGICESVLYYPRNTSVLSHLSLWPYIVKSRYSEKLIQNLLKDDYPILFEGMHSLAVGLDKRLKGRKKIYRESNIEHHYYYHLYKSEKNIFKKLFFKVESWKLKYFEKQIVNFDRTLVVSKADQVDLETRYPQLKIDYLPSFHPDNNVSTKLGKGDYALYIGNLSVPENILAAEYLIKEVFSDLDYPFVVAGLNPPAHLTELISGYSNISIKSNISDKEMTNLIQNAQFNVLITFQATGLKLKLLSTLFQGRFVLVNDKMLKGTGLDSLCVIGNTPEEIKSKIKELKSVKFTEPEISNRVSLLGLNYSNNKNIKKLLDFLF